MRKKLLFIFSVFYFSICSYSQCGPGTPTFIVNLTGNPSAVWTSPNINRNDNCCGTTAPDRCIKFVITLDPAAVGVSFNVISGALPPGALYYQIGCGPPTPVGQPICLSGPYPVILTFCKPGNNQNVYQITSIPPATAGTNVTINDGCTGQLFATGFIDSTVTWNSIYPGPSGFYNNYLSCTSGCVNPTVTAQAGYPPYVDYVVCGTPAALCASTTICDTVRVTFNTTLVVTILPTVPTICFGQTSITLTANGSGGTPPYTYLWNNINTAQSINVGAGTYNVQLSDSSGCPPTYASVTVTSFSVVITANAGPDDTICTQNPIVSLNGSVTGASGGIWSGGAGIFSPNNATLNGNYTPTAAELANGFVNLTLITTGNGSCPPDTDMVTIYFMGFTGTTTTTAVNVSCYGGNNGSATVNVSGGIIPYSYFWNTVPAQTTSTASNLSAGTYSVTITNGIGCTFTTSVIITQPPPLTLNATINNVPCFGGNNGTISASANGGTPAYTYLWNPGGQTTANASNLSAGTYTLTVTDSKGCQFTSTYTVTQPTQLSVSLSPVNVSCFNGSNGSISSSVVGGTPLYTYSWTPVSATSPNVSGLLAGTYTLIVTDSKGCTKTATVTISQPTALTASVTSTNETCNYLNNGTASVIVSGGSPGYSYNWQPGGQTSSAVSNLSSGNYTVTVTDMNGCTTFALIIITQPLALAINFMNQSNVSCFGGSNGAVTANVTGGTPNYTYLWNPGGQTTANASNLSAGTYTLTATDNNGCQVQSIVIITQPLVALSVAATATAVSCGGGSNGTLSASASGGTASYTYIWQPGNYTTQNISNIVAGNYTVTTVDANGCTATNTVTVTQPSTITLTPSTVNAACASSNGQASVAVSGGVSPYSYLWNPTGQTTSAATGLAAGSYTVVVTDANGCTAVTVGNISNNLGPTASILSTTNVSCYGGTNGSATATASGGTLPYTYSWNTTPAQTTSTATGLPAGNYVVTVTDGTGCQSLASASPITQPSQIIVTVSTGSVTCFGGGSTASVSASGGTPGYNYIWFPSGNTGNTISGLVANTTYTTQATDANSCVQTTTFVINQPAPLSSTVTSSNVSCNGGNNGSATVNVSGGTPFYTYSWMPSGGNGPTVVGLSAGSYTVNIVDANGCTQSSTVAITQPAQALTASASTSAVNCFGGGNGTATINPSGGTPGYSYQWSPSGGTNQIASGLSAGNYFVIVTDANGCQTNVSLTISQPSVISGTLVPTNPSCGLSNGSISSQISGGTPPYSFLWTPTSSTSATLTGVGPGNYTLQVTDAANCTATYTATLNNIPGPSVVLSSVNNVSCFGGNNGTATVTITQGTAPYVINWSPYGGTNLSATGLIAGTYTVIVTDALGCTNLVTATLTQPTPVSVSNYSVTPVSCNGGNNGAITVYVSGGTPSYTYFWSNGQTTSSATNLSAGTYTVTVWDQNNCSSSIAINITQPSSPISSSISSFSNASCYAGSGSATVIASGGTIPYYYSWSTSPVQTTSTATNLFAGTYTVTTMDVNGCTAVSNVTITQPTPVITIASPNDTACMGQSLTLTATASGGAGNYYYAWQPSSVINSGTLIVTPSTSTTYIVIAYDQNGCAGTADTVSAIVYTLTGANIQAIAYSPICPGQSSIVYVQTSGNTGPLTYVWNNSLGNGPGGYYVNPTQPTTYIVTVTNACGASVTDSVQITLNPPPTMSLTSDTNTSCVPALIQFYDNSVSGNSNDPIISWYWSFGDGNYSTASDPTHTYTQPGTYSVTLTVTTSGGCSNNTGSAPLIIYAMPSPSAGFATNPSVTPMTNQTINFINQSSGAVSYFWDFGDGGTSTLINPQHHFPTNGFYTVTLITTNQYGCTDTFRIQTTGEGDIVFPNAFTPNSAGANGGGYNPFNLDNDVFFPFASGIDIFHMEIFNRWGELIFVTDDIKIGWDGYYRGKLCQQDVYAWKAYAKFIDARTVNRVGDVTLLR